MTLIDKEIDKKTDQTVDVMDAIWEEITVSDDELDAPEKHEADLKDGEEGGDALRKEGEGEEEKVGLKEFEESEEKDDGGKSEADDDEPLQPLQHWRPELRETFKGLPRKAQEFVIARDKEFQSSVTRVQQESATLRKQLTEVNEALLPVADEMRYYGVTPANTIRSLVGAHKLLLEKPADGIHYIMRQYGVSMEQVLKPDAAPKEPSEEQKRLAQLESRESARVTEEQRRHAQALGGYIKDYFDKNPEHLPAMGEMTRRAWMYRSTGQEPPPLEALFEESKWNVPEIREKLVGNTRTNRSRDASSLNISREADAPRRRGGPSESDLSTADLLSEEWSKAERQAL